MNDRQSFETSCVIKELSPRYNKTMIICDMSIQSGDFEIDIS
jgi:hypothetical protein